MNNVTISGNLVRDVELRYTQKEVPFSGFTVAVNREYGKDNEKKETSFIPCQAWGKLAEEMSTLTKGTPVIIDGYLRTRSYENRQGVKVFVMEVLASKVVTERKKLAEKKEVNNYEPDVNDDDCPF